MPLFRGTKRGKRVQGAACHYLDTYCICQRCEKDFHCRLGAAGALTAMMIKRLGYAEKYWSLLFTINGGLTGMVGIVQIFYCCHLPLRTRPSLPRFQGPVSRKSRNFSGDIFLLSSKRRCSVSQNFAVILIFIPFTTYEKTSFTE